MTIKAMAVELRDLHKIRTPVGDCEGFDITEFDNLIEVGLLPSHFSSHCCLGAVIRTVMMQTLAESPVLPLELHGLWLRVQCCH